MTSQNNSNTIVARDLLIMNSAINNAAIYARTSGDYDNHSIPAQIDEAKSLLEKRGLLCYGIYTDKISGLSTPPEERPGFSKLLADAKQNSFSHIVLYRLDRLVRNYNDWISIKETLNNLNIKILLSSTGEDLSNSSPQAEFIQNLTVMIAELEPNTITARASEGKTLRRNAGYYPAAKHAPFGYTYDTSTKTFSKTPVLCAFINYLFEKFSFDIDNNGKSLKLTNFKKEVRIFFNKVRNEYETSNKVKPSNISYENCFISILKNEKLTTSATKNKTLTPYDIKKGLDSIEKFFKFNTNDVTNIKNILTNIVYSGRIFSLTFKPKDITYESTLLKAQIDFLNKNHLSYDGKSLTLPRSYTDKVVSKSGLEDTKVISPVIQTVNIDGFISFDTFVKVYIHIKKVEFNEIDTTKDFAFKGNLKCSNNKKLLLENDIFLTCGCKNCPTFVLSDILKLIIRSIVASALVQTDTSKKYSGINTLLKEINSQIDKLNSDIAVNNTNKLNFLKTSLKSPPKDKSIPNEIFNFSTIDLKYKSESASLKVKRDSINRLKSILTPTSPETPDDVSSKIIKDISNYIVNNLDIYLPFINSFVKEIVVNAEKSNKRNRSNKTDLSIKYRVTAEINSDIQEGIH